MLVGLSSSRSPSPSNAFRYGTFGERRVPYVLAVEPRSVGGDAEGSLRAAPRGVPGADRVGAEIERQPPSPGYLGAAIHHYGTLANR